MNNNKLKTCGKCNILKSLNSFHKNKDGKDGYRSNCKDCCKTYHIGHYKENIDILKEKRNEYYLNNKETILQRSINYNVENKKIINKRRYLKLNNNPLEKNL